MAKKEGEAKATAEEKCREDAKEVSRIGVGMANAEEKPQQEPIRRLRLVLNGDTSPGKIKFYSGVKVHASGQC